ncbi:DNA primase [Chamaesiphon minutus]|uniref:DNA primase n=1 Tax=Chamaesiphon minutus (strain ATCC 27169 / PCC 6605) TaxID=1173020 RepID=K9UGV1_CHAP6|nr:DNA primase [Chamaesiphon minutus]AFY94045.1 DNA primase, catalytic core [Chamaesiphon minutus PCC 6605]
MDIPRLHPDTIEEVKAKVDIIEVIGGHVVLKKRGKDYLGSCPFHQEKSPSFSVSPTKQMYYCFGCQAGGNAITFLMELGKQSFTEVVLDLARRYQVPVQTLEPEQRQELQRRLSQREQLYEIMAITASFYQHALNQPQGEKALTYLKEERTFSDETIQGFQLGYAPAGWETLSNYLIEQKNFPPQAIVSAGLAIARKDGNSYYDRFRDRLMIPICDLRSRVIGFGGRTLSDEQPKYLNSPETELFDKGNTLYGLDRAKDAISKTDRAVVVEGYFDVIALHAAGIDSAVAALGTALSLAQVKQLAKFTESKQIILNFDADKAGNIATERAIGAVFDLAYNNELQLRVVNLSAGKNADDLPIGKDADEFLKKNGHEKYLELLNRAPLWLDWQIEKAIKGKDLTQAEQYQDANQTIIKILQNITDLTTRTIYLKKSALLLSADDARMVPLLIETLQTAIKGLKPLPESKNGETNLPANRFNFIEEGQRQSSKYSTLEVIDYPEQIEEVNYGNETEERDKKQLEIAPVGIHPNQRLIERAEGLLLRIYLHYPIHRLTIIDALDSADLNFTLSHHRFLWEQIINRSSSGYQDSQPEEIDYLDDRLISKLQDSLVEDRVRASRVEHLFNLDEHTAEEIQRSPLVLRAAIACLEKFACEQKRKYYLNKLQSKDPEDLAKKVEYYQSFINIQKRLQELEKQRNVTITDLISFM